MESKIKFQIKRFQLINKSTEVIIQLMNTNNINTNLNTLSHKVHMIIPKNQNIHP